jgi:dihydrofolate reductase
VRVRQARLGDRGTGSYGAGLARYLAERGEVVLEVSRTPRDERRFRGKDDPLDAAGYIAGPDGSFDWTTPDEEVFRFFTDQTRELAAHVMGRRLYETMLYWETADQNPALDYDTLEWASVWRPLPKVVFSTTLSAVEGNARLASGSLVEEIERLRGEPGDGDIGIGGATLAGEAAQLGLIDEFRPMVNPVVVGGGIPFYPQCERRLDLELIESRTFSSRVVYLRYRVAH